MVIVLATAIVPAGVAAKPQQDCRRFTPGANLSKCDLRGLNLGGANLAGANLSKARLDDANLRDAILIGADLTKVSAVETSFVHADLSDAIFVKGDFSFADFENAVLLDPIGIDSADLDFIICVDGTLIQNGVCPGPAPVLDVRIVDTLGQALAGILVQLYEDGDTDGDGTPGELFGSKCTSDRDPADLFGGEADFSGVADGSYRVVATDSGASCAAAGQFEDAVAPVAYSFYTDTADDILDDDVKGTGVVMVGSPDATLALAPVVPLGTLDVFVGDADPDEGLSGILVFLYDADNVLLAFACTIDGEAQFVVPNGEYILEATDTSSSDEYPCGDAGVFDTEFEDYTYNIADDIGQDDFVDDDLIAWFATGNDDAGSPDFTFLLAPFP